MPGVGLIFKKLVIVYLLVPTSKLRLNPAHCLLDVRWTDELELVGPQGLHQGSKLVRNLGQNFMNTTEKLNLKYLIK